MRKVFLFICSIFVLLCACSEHNDEIYSEHYVATFIELEPGDNIPEETYFDELFDYVPFTKQEVGMAEPMQKGAKGKRTETMYDLVIRTSDAILTIKGKTEEEKRFVQSKEFKYTYQPGVYLDGVIEVRSNAIIVNGKMYRPLIDFSESRKEAYGKEYIETATETTEYNGVFAIQRYEDIVELKNNDCTYKVEYVNGGCNLTEVSPNSKNIGVLEKQ
ncbi:hypothetical protein [Bacteroides acidifaciens]|jgi:hypothetical protein|uniref:Lipoprotein n=1 Tax=Bacteroides acidifaciens TaxID=85831 RepID=A0A7J0A5C9_9BACE|nr:hypothetical protein [Bacteroides acidifaciens]GFH87141.1 hypothetical protein IMSAGC001_02566 [Bacteroides acidifaciens]